MAVVRIVTPDDLLRIAAANPLSVGTPGNPHREKYELQQSGDVSWLVAWIDDQPCGSVTISWPGSSGELTEQGRSLGCAEIRGLDVDEAVRGQEIGRALMEAAEALARKREVELLGLEVTATNPNQDAARALERQPSLLAQSWPRSSLLGNAAWWNAHGHHLLFQAFPRLVNSSLHSRDLDVCPTARDGRTCQCVRWWVELGQMLRGEAPCPRQGPGAAPPRHHTFFLPVSGADNGLYGKRVSMSAPKSHLRQLRNEAKRLLSSCQSGDTDAVGRLRRYAGRLQRLADPEVSSAVVLRDAQHVVARESGFPTWEELIAACEDLLGVDRHGLAQLLSDRLPGVGIGDVRVLQAGDRGGYSGGKKALIAVETDSSRGELRLILKRLLPRYSAEADVYGALQDLAAPLATLYAIVDNPDQTRTMVLEYLPVSVDWPIPEDYHLAWAESTARLAASSRSERPAATHHEVDLKARAVRNRPRRRPCPGRFCSAGGTGPSCLTFSTRRRRHPSPSSTAISMCSTQAAGRAITR